MTDKEPKPVITSARVHEEIARRTEERLKGTEHHSLESRLEASELSAMRSEAWRARLQSKMEDSK